MDIHSSNTTKIIFISVNNTKTHKIMTEYLLLIQLEKKLIQLHYTVSCKHNDIFQSHFRYFYNNCSATYFLFPNTQFDKPLFCFFSKDSISSQQMLSASIALPSLAKITKIATNMIADIF